MGSSGNRQAAAYQKERVLAADAKRLAVADKIVMAITDRICSDLIRPGPKPEERECYVMAQELRDMRNELTALVRAVLDVEGNG
jgi:hypothetical protein